MVKHRSEFVYLGLEFWILSFFPSITLRIRIPFKIDKATLDGDFVHFARVLVGIDLTKPLPHTITMQKDDYHFMVSLESGKLPPS